MIAGYLACVAKGAEHVKSSEPHHAYATPMVVKVTANELMSSPDKLEKLLQYQHVYVTGVPANATWAWNLESMKKLGNIDVICEVQG